MSKLHAPDVPLLTRLCDRSIIAGLACFTRLGYGARQLSAAALPERQDGRRVVITGATSGLGLATAHRLAAMQAELVLVGRDASRLQRVARDIVSRHGRSPRTEIADLESMEEVRQLAARLLDDDAPVHVLINNAGALFAGRELTDEGNERSLAVNLLAPFLLTRLLMPRLIQSAPARIVNVSSGGMYTQRFAIDDLQFERGKFDGAKAYARAKRGLVMLTDQWADELADKRVAVHAMHPGWADTPGVRNALPGFYRITRPFLRSAEEGADTIVWLATASEPAQTTGGFWLDRSPHLKHVLPGTGATDADIRRLQPALAALIDGPTATATIPDGQLVTA